MTKILVIEDEAHIRDEVMDWLHFEGYEVVGAANGQLGMAAIYQEHPDLILCDITMPEMDGHEVLFELRSNANFSHIPFVFLTAAADRDSIRLGMDMGASDYLPKPFTHAEILNAVRSRLGLKAMEEQEYLNQIDMFNRAFTEEREKRLLKSRLVAMFSHDFRNPLASILSASSIIRNYEDRLTPERKQRHLDRIDGSVRQLLQMLDDMLMIAEMESGHLDFLPQPVDLASFVETIVDEFRLIDQDAHQLIVQNSLFGQVEIDTKLVRQMLANLLSNAIKYSPQDTSVTVRLYEQADCIRLEVADKGMGIPEDSRDHLFEPFHRASNARNVKGTGLGLAIVKECVERHSGHISVESALDEGTVFKVELPLERALNAAR